ncbi:hypothetical protein [Riemerella columbipharyngis]|uniref:Uncharacterized protein n=1 Tax=Riemerella columbipharyngis TaxID=1071918 RepID=A0A1G7FUJ2_9FLAO|nr:hypothetical protein [Riemerella columbipharyngis]SDE79531.1 hypothetical protein SAMN05421544_1283 [Riemerella columbipharyngis]
MTIKEIKKHLGLQNKDIAEMFGYKTPYAFNKSSARGRIEKGLELFYQKILDIIKKEEQDGNN